MDRLGLIFVLIAGLIGALLGGAITYAIEDSPRSGNWKAVAKLILAGAVMGASIGALVMVLFLGFFIR